MLSRERKIGVEFDGPLHFLKTSWKPNVEERIARDAEVERFMVQNGWCYVRVSFDQFNGRAFSGEALEFLRRKLESPVPGVHKIGGMYAENR